MSTPARFSDGQYKNWIKCSHALIITKEVHVYIDKEVKKLHNAIKQNVSSKQCAPSFRKKCGSCKSWQIQWTEVKPGKPGYWSINCKICNEWIQTILAFHDEPYNPGINWKNADMSKWPTDWYEVAKIFMPKGQYRTFKIARDFDAPAILSLLKYCSWFRKYLPNPQILSDLINFRNKIYHSADLKVADSDKDRMIDLMIQLLKDLKIQGDAISNLETLKKEDIDINFRENEIRVFQRMASDLASDFTTLKEDMAFMQKSLSEVMEKVSDSKTETSKKVDALEADMAIIRNSLDERQVIYDKMVSFFDKNPDIHEKEITEGIRTIGMDVKDLHRNLTRVETELQSRISSLEKHHEETNIEIKGIKEKMEGLDVRLSDVEEQKKHETERTRPETDGLRQLKNQTESILRTHRKLEYIITEQAKKAEKLLAEKRSIVIKGNPGEGKTSLSRHLIDNEKFKDKRVVLNKPSQWDNVDTDYVDIVVLEDVFGQYDFDPGRFQKWMIYLPTIQDHVAVGELQVIVTTRVDVLSKASCQRLRSLKLFSKELSLTLSSEQLTNSEKFTILKTKLDKQQSNMKEEKIKECIANFGGLIGFPQCCSLFAGDSKSFDKGPEFFRSPKKFFVENIEGLEATRFLSLAFLFCNGEILEENLSSDTMPESSKKLLMELGSRLQISKKNASIELLRNAYDNFWELYVMKSRSYNFSLNPVVEKPSIMFTHATVSEAVGHVLWQRCCEMVVKYGDSEYLYQRTYTAEVQDSTLENAFLPLYVYGLLAERMVHDVVNRRLVSSVVKHSALKRHDFIKKLKEELNKGNVLTDFFMAGKDEFQSDNLSEGECVTFMQYILQGDKDVVRLVYSEFLEMMACAHNDNIPDCWWCVEKQNLLELALYFHHFEIADKLIARKARYTHVSLCNAAKHGDIKRVQTITESLKKNRVFDPEFAEAKYALYRAYVSGNQSLIDFLLKEGIVLDSWYGVNAVKHGDINVLIDVVKHLIDHKKWNPDWKREWIDGTLFASCSDSIYRDWRKPLLHNKGSCFVVALYFAYCNEKFHIADYLLKNGVKIENYMLAYVSKYCSQKAASRVITDLIDKGTWDPHGDDASKALETAICKQMDDLRDLLVRNGVSLKMKNLPRVIRGSEISLEDLKKVIQHFKNTNNWVPEGDYASEALETAIHRKKYDVYDLLVKNGVTINMKNLIGIIMRSDISLESLKKAIQYLKDTKKWKPECDDAYEALKTAIHRRKYDLYNQLVLDGVLLQMKHLPDIIRAFYTSSEYIVEAIQHLQDTGIWDPKCDDASKALETAIYRRKYDVYDLLVKDGVSLKMKNLPFVIRGSEISLEISLEDLKKVIKHLKDTNNWKPECDDASEALEAAIYIGWDEAYELLVLNRVSLKMKNLFNIILGFNVSLKSVTKVIQHLKETKIWNSECDDAYKALEAAIYRSKNDLYDLLVKNKVSLKMKNLLGVIKESKMSLEPVKKAIQHLQETKIWNSNCDDVSEALETAICEQRNDVYDLLVKNEVSLKMKNLFNIIMISQVSLESVTKVIQHLKEAGNWVPNCDDASKALAAASCQDRYDVVYLLVQEGVLLNEDYSG